MLVKLIPTCHRSIIIRLDVIAKGQKDLVSHSFFQKNVKISNKKSWNRVANSYERLHFHSERLYSQTWANDRLRLTTTRLQKPLLWRRLIFQFWSTKEPLDNDRLSTTATIFVSRGWSLHSGMTVIVLLQEMRTLKLGSRLINLDIKYQGRI
jgi:hypothetical protein